MVKTGSYKNCFNKYGNQYKYSFRSISGDRGKQAEYIGESYSKLAPKLSFWQTWHDNINKIIEEENIKYYIEQYYQQVLSKLDPYEVYNNLNNHILLCYENNDEFCHRHIVSEWLKLYQDEDIKEIAFTSSGIEILPKPKNIEFIKNTLEETIREKSNMYGFSSLRAAAIFKESEEIEKLAYEKEKNGTYHYHQLYEMDFGLHAYAASLRVEADEEELKYKKLIRQKNRNN